MNGKLKYYKNIIWCTIGILQAEATNISALGEIMSCPPFHSLNDRLKFFLDTIFFLNKIKIIRTLISLIIPKFYGMTHIEVINY